MSGYTIKVATDLYSQKVNYLIDFPALPSIPALRAKLEQVFMPEVERRRPAGAPHEPFIIDHIQRFDVSGWSELTEPADLSQGCQLYVFQPPSVWHCDAQTGLPVAVRPPALTATPTLEPVSARGVSPRRDLSPAPIVPGLSPTPIPVPLPTTAAAIAIQRELSRSPVPFAVPPVAPAVPAAAAVAAVAGTSETVHYAHNVLSELVETSNVARAATLAAEHEVNEANQRLSAQEMRAVDATRVADTATLRLSEATKAAEAARSRLVATRASAEAVRNSEKQAVDDHQRIIEQVGVADTKFKAQEAETLRAQQRLAEVARLVAQQRVEVERNRELAVRAAVDSDAAEGRVAQHLAAVETAKESVAACEGELRLAMEQLRVQEAAADAADAALVKTREDGIQRKVQVTNCLTAIAAAKEVEALRRQEQVEAQRLVGIAQSRLMTQNDETSKMELKLKEVESLFKMQELEVQRHRELAERYKQELDAARVKEDAAGQAALDAQRAVHAAEDELMQAEVELEKALAAEREAQAAQVVAQSEVDRLRATVTGKQTALARANDRLRACEGAVDEARIAVKDAEVRRATSEAELKSAEARLAELEKLHATQVSELEVHQETTIKCRQDLITCTEKEKQAAVEVSLINTMAANATEELRKRELEVTSLEESESLATHAKVQADGEKAVQISLVSATEKHLSALREKEVIRRAAEEETLIAADQQSRLTRSLEREHLEQTRAALTSLSRQYPHLQSLA